MNMWDSPVAVQVKSSGLRWMFGPFEGMPAAMEFVSEHVCDTDRYRHEYVCLIAPVEASRLLRQPARAEADDAALFELPPRERREPLEAALRDAIAEQHGERGDGPYGDGLLAHLDVHRPWRVTLKDPECAEGCCDHQRDTDGNCAVPGSSAVWCRGCTPTYDGGSEHDGNPLAECEVDWPCSPVRTMCASFGVPLLGKNLGGIR